MTKRTKEKEKETGPAAEKRARIKKTKQQMMVIVLVGALSVGICIVLMIHFYKYISFYGKVIGKKDEAISDYEETIQNIGICSSKPKGMHYSKDDIEGCDPDNEQPALGTLRTNITEVMANNKDLESVARDEAVSICYDEETGKRKDYQALMNTVSDDEKSHYLGLLKICSSLRVIPDALPAGKNVEALLASLNKIFTISGFEPEGIAPSEDAVETEIDGVQVIPVTLTVESVSTQTMLTVLNNIENSIRAFDMATVEIEWSGEEGLDLRGAANAYYAEDAGVVETETVEYATKEARKKANKVMVVEDETE